jgi:DNA-binding NarL/FixJ family response regulator
MQTVVGSTEMLSSSISADSTTAVAPSLIDPIPSKTGSRWRVLIVDDHASIRELLRIILESHSDIIEVVGEASDGEEAVAQAEHHPVDLVLMDVNLPHESGIEATRQIKQLQPQVVILGMSAEYSSHYYHAMLAVGAVAFVRKEEAADLLLKTIVSSMFRYIPYTDRVNHGTA